MGIIIHKRLLWTWLIKIRHSVMSVFIIFKCRVLLSIYVSKICINKLAYIICNQVFLIGANQVIMRR